MIGAIAFERDRIALLVVEDDRPIADLLKHHFAAAGFTVTTTPNGDEALILIDEIKPDLLILDWMIEGTSGIEIQYFKFGWK